MYVKGIYVNGTDDLNEVFTLRKEIFGTAESAFNRYFDIDTTLYAENLAVHALVLDDDMYVAGGSLFYDGENFVLDNVGVLTEKRRQKIGDFVVRMLIDRAFQVGPNKVYAYCSADVVPFFETIGFAKCDEMDGVIKLWIDEKYVCKECHKMSK